MTTQVAAPSIAGLVGRFVVPVRLIFLVGLFAAALGIRLFHVDDPPLSFHATRQYRSLLLARHYYLEMTGSGQAWERDVAALSAERQGVLEPPLLEHVVSLGYWFTGGESMWLPKVLSSIFWLIGGVWLYRIARRLAGSDAAIVSTAFYLFLPFAVLASRSFQPDPLMVMALLGSLLAMLRYTEHPSAARLCLSAGASALAVLVKPMALFPLLCAFLALSIARQGVAMTVRSPMTVAFALFMVVPMAVVYIYGLLSGTFLVGEAEKTLLPQLLVSPFFWAHWADNIGAVVSFPVVLAALVGTALLKQPSSMALMLGAWVGYVLFCLAVNYNLATHDYYQLQLIPIAALGLAPLAAALGRWFVARQKSTALLRCAGWSALAVVVAIAMTRSESRLGMTSLNQEAQVAEQIGAEVQHSTRTIYLAADYGVPLEFHGRLSGRAWPLASDLEWEQLTGVQQLSAEQRFQAWFARDKPEYFIVLDLTELDNQPDLKDFLIRNFVLVTRAPEYWLFDLRQV